MNNLTVRIRAVRWAVLLIAMGLIAVGIATGEAEIVWQKAVRICLECIGIG